MNRVHEIKNENKNNPIELELTVLNLPPTGGFLNEGYTPDTPYDSSSRRGSFDPSQRRGSFDPAQRRGSFDPAQRRGSSIDRGGSFDPASRRGSYIMHGRSSSIPSISKFDRSVSSNCSTIY